MVMGVVVTAFECCSKYFPLNLEAIYQHWAVKCIVAYYNTPKPKPSQAHKQTLRKTFLGNVLDANVWGRWVCEQCGFVWSWMFAYNMPAAAGCLFSRQTRTLPSQTTESGFNSHL